MAKNIRTILRGPSNKYNFKLMPSGIQQHRYRVHFAGNINPYVTSYIRKHSSPRTLQYSDTVWVFALAVTGQGLVMFFGGVLERKLGTRAATLIGSLMTR